MDPQIIVLDEPSAFLDPMGQSNLVAILDDLNRKGKTILIATHDVDMAAEWATSIIVIKDGRVLAQGGIDLLVKPDLVEAAGLRFPLISQVFEETAVKYDLPLPCTVEEGKKTLLKLTRH